MERRLFLKWISAGSVGLMVPKYFDMHVPPGVTVISSRDMRIPLELRPRGLGGPGFGALYGGAAGGGKTMANVLPVPLPFRPDQATLRELELVRQKVKEIFKSEDTLYEHIGKDKTSLRPIQRSLFDGEKTVPIIHPDYADDWEDEW